MKKTVLMTSGLVFILAAAVLAPPYWLSLKAEKAFGDGLGAMGNQSGLHLSRSSFTRGWFSSRAETVLEFPGNAPIHISAQHSIYHGPLLVGRWFEGNFDTTLKQTEIETRGEITLTAKEPSGPAGTVAFSADTTIGLDGAGHTRISSPAFTRTMAPGKLEWHGLQGDIHFDAGMQHVQSEFTAPGLKFPMGEVANIRMHSDTHEGVAGQMLGKTTFEVGSVSFEPLVYAKGFKLSIDNAAQGDALSVGVVYELPDLRIAEQQHGPARLAIEVRKLDATVLARFQEELRALQRSDRPAEQQGLMQMGKLLQLVGELAKKSPELEITELGFRMNGEEVRGKARFVLDGSKSDIAENPLLMLTAISGDVDVSLPAAIIKPMLLPLLKADLENFRRQGKLKKGEAEKLTPEQLSIILDRSMPTYLARNEFTRHLVADGNRLRLTASLRRGQVTVNGEPFSMGGMGMPALQ